jgi:hypothetical protein
MPLHTCVLADGRGVVQTGEGIVTAEEILADLVALRGDSSGQANHEYVLVDFSRVTRIVARASDLERFVHAQQSVAMAAPRVAIAIAASGDVVFGLSRMWEGMAAHLSWEKAVFRTRAEAIAWLREQRGPLDIPE